MSKGLYIIPEVKKFLKRFILRRPQIRYNFGYIPDKPDDRDIVYKVHRPGLAPTTTNRRNISQFRYRYNQGSLGSCVGHGVCEAFRRVLQVNHMPDLDPSRLFAYYIAREDKSCDTGASIRDAFKAINRLGLCKESTWPYDVARFAEKPPDEAFKEGEDHQVISYARIPQNKIAIMEVISQGFPIVYGKILYESFMSKQVECTGMVPKPHRCREERYGGHCMVIFDYDETGTIELNSWSDQWGQAGVCHVPWEYVLDGKLSHDLWTIYLTEG